MFTFTTRFKYSLYNKAIVGNPILTVHLEVVLKKLLLICVGRRTHTHTIRVQLTDLSSSIHR